MEAEKEAQMRWAVAGLIHRWMIVGEVCRWGQCPGFTPIQRSRCSLWPHSWNPFSPSVTWSHVHQVKRVLSSSYAKHDSIRSQNIFTSSAVTDSSCFTSFVITCWFSCVCHNHTLSTFVYLVLYPCEGTVAFKLLLVFVHNAHTAGNIHKKLWTVLQE